MPTSRQTAVRSTTTAGLCAAIGLLAAASLGCAEPDVRRAARPPMAVHLTIHSRLEGTAPVQVAIGRARLWNAPPPRGDAARPAGGHYRVSADTVRVTATLDDGRPCRRKAALESRREAWLDVILEADDCTIRIRYGVPEVAPDSAPRLPGQVLFIASVPAARRGAGPGLTA